MGEAVVLACGHLLVPGALVQPIGCFLTCFHGSLEFVAHPGEEAVLLYVWLAGPGWGEGHSHSSFTAVEFCGIHNVCM